MYLYTYISLFITHLHLLNHATSIFSCYEIKKSSENFVSASVIPCSFKSLWIVRI